MTLREVRFTIYPIEPNPPSENSVDLGMMTQAEYDAAHARYLADVQGGKRALWCRADVTEPSRSSEWINYHEEARRKAFGVTTSFVTAYFDPKDLAAVAAAYREVHGQFLKLIGQIEERLLFADSVTDEVNKELPK